MRFAAIFVVTFAGFGCSQPQTPLANKTFSPPDARIENLSKQKAAVVRFFEPMKLEDGDWLQTQTEAGETFEQYVASKPTLPTAERRTIYIQPIGNFTAEQRNAIRLTAEYMKAFYNRPVILNDVLKLGNVPLDLKRESGYPKRMQIRTQYFLDEVLPDLSKDDAAALIAFTNYDLYPGDTWAFVFGQATLRNRFGVWSMARLSDHTLGNPNALVDRTLKIAMHEVGHMFSMRHCTQYECLMSGTNHLAETDRRPLDNCPECMAKLAWAMDYDPAERYKRLSAFWKKQGRPAEAQRSDVMAKAVADAIK